MKDENEDANVEGEKINWKNNNVQILISLHGDMEPKFVKIYKM
jgi:hypothetical protein